MNKSAFDKLRNELFEMADPSKNLCLFYKTSCYLSNFYPSVFTIDEIEFTSVEQYFQYEKTKMFKDLFCMEKIMRAKTLKQQKYLGNHCQDYDEDKWRSSRILVMKTGLMAKFQQNADLQQKLLATRGFYLAESSATDKVWGIGLGSDDVNARNPSKWSGQNLLGILLMEVRDNLIEN